MAAQHRPRMPAPTSTRGRKVIGSSASTISGVDVQVLGGTGNSNVAIETTGTINNVTVDAANGAVSPIGVMLDADGALLNSEVELPLVGSTGVAAVGPRTVVADSMIQAASGVMASGGTTSVSLARLVIDFGGVAAVAYSDSMKIADSLLVNRSEAIISRTALLADSSATDATLSADHVTLIGTTDSDSVGLYASASGNATTTISFRNGVITGYPTTFHRVAAGPGAANISTDYSDYGGAASPNSGPGAITETNHVNVAPGFLGPQDYHLAPGSPLVDAGDPAGLAAGDSSTDASGAARITDGNGDCSARRDVGAYEFQPGPRAPHAAAIATPAQSVTSQEVTFDASGSCDPDGEALTYSWTFDDGGGGPGASLARTFSASGVHFGTVTVTDSTGRSSTATASVFVAEPSPPGPIPFAGVTIAKQTVRASKKGVVAVKVGCPAATAASCTGTLRLGGGSKAFSIKSAATRKVSVRLSRKTRKQLARNKRLHLRASAKAHDGNGSARNSSGQITVLRPH